ncbi:MAG: LysR family transcriptional regulator, partial [Desulfovibrio sp.]|nr:LysR family transcriptional regulator [Desulfovibrio sp.]
MTRQPPLTPRESHWLWYFALAAEERSLRKAAARLYMSEAPLSRQIKALEERLGCALFHRHSRGLALTAEGERLLAVVRPLLDLQERVFAELGALAAEAPPGAIGLTTAVEQGVFAALEG